MPSATPPALRLFAWALASMIACRREPAPLSCVLSTMNVLIMQRSSSGSRCRRESLGRASVRRRRRESSLMRFTLLCHGNNMLQLLSAWAGPSQHASAEGDRYIRRIAEHELQGDTGADIQDVAGKARVQVRAAQ